MLALLLAIVCSAAHALALKRGVAGGRHRLALTVANYGVAAAGAALLLALAGPGREVLAGAGRTLALAALLGAATGGLYVAAILWYQECIARHGVGLAGTFGKLGLLLPVPLSVVAFGARPDAAQWAGVAAGAVAIVLLTLPGGVSLRAAARPGLLLLLGVMGLCEFMAKVFEASSPAELEYAYVFATFATSLAVAALLLRRDRRPVVRGDLWAGVAVGLPNLGSLVFLIGALGALPAPVVFASFATGSLLLIVVGGAALFGERLTRREAGAVALAVFALLLLHAGGGAA